MGGIGGAHTAERGLGGAGKGQTGGWGGAGKEVGGTVVQQERGGGQQLGVPPLPGGAPLGGAEHLWGGQHVVPGTPPSPRWGAGLCPAFGAQPRPLPFPRAGRRGAGAQPRPPLRHHHPPNPALSPHLTHPPRSGSTRSPSPAPLRSWPPPEPSTVGLILLWGSWGAPRGLPPPQKPGLSPGRVECAGAGAAAQGAAGNVLDPPGGGAVTPSALPGGFGAGWCSHVPAAAL